MNYTNALSTSQATTEYISLPQCALNCIQQCQQAVAPLIIITPDMLIARQLHTAIHFFQPDLPALIFPDWETLPYDHFSPHQDIISSRLQVLYQLPTMQQSIVLLPVTTLIQHLAPVDYVQSHSLVMRCGQTINLTYLQQQLIHSGYQRVEQVMQRGEFALRGSLIDLFPMGSPNAYRIDFLDDEVDSIRSFDLDTQHSIEQLDCIDLLPAREFPLTADSISHFRQQWRNQFPGNPANCPMYQAISDGILLSGVEYYLPLFFAQTADFFAYLPIHSQLIWINPTSIDHYWQTIEQRYEQYRHDASRPLLAPDTLFLTNQQLSLRATKFPQQHYQLSTKSDFHFSQDINALQQILAEKSQRTLFCVESLGRREYLCSWLASHNIHPTLVDDWQTFLHGHDKVAITVATLTDSVKLYDSRINLISEQAFHHEPHAPESIEVNTNNNSPDPNLLISDLKELHPGDAIVHIHHGIGRYIGLQLLNTGEAEAEYLTLHYANDNKLYIPITDFHLIHRYTGAESSQVSLHHLGSDQWQKVRKKAAEKIRDVAAELLEVYAHRAKQTGFAFSRPDAQYYQFVAKFPFNETPDQTRAIHDVLNDLTAHKTMDRLVCGDVGFGKTEVAMRAAFVAIYNKKQVAILVPTTLLAQQHYETFVDRFADFAVNIEVLSRFRSTKEQQNITQKLTEGKIDIIIATHKLIQKSIRFYDLGLLIIDEEHRFGVRQKERIKALRSQVDILTLTATPIPRTLNMALSNLRDLSIIGTPPARRLAIKTFVHEYDPYIIQEAISRELMRGGQVYFLHNNIKTIAQRAQDIRNYLPQAQVCFAHGQMRELELENIMSDFYHQRFNVLICTTIIETGLDVANANTIIIERADKLGLAQLHQLRGRVGRSHHQAYAYLLTPDINVITKDAEKRLIAISELEELGAGFTLATHDLEIRGAGELLGDAQSGQLQAIGFSLYMEMLEQTVSALQNHQQVPDPDDLLLTQQTEIDLHIPCLLPADYVHDVHTRLILYKRIANAADSKTLDNLQIECIDRFGLLPDVAKNLFAIAKLKLQARQLGINKIDMGSDSGCINFNKEPKINLQNLIKLIQTQPQVYQLENSDRLHFQLSANDHRIEAINKLISLLK